MQRRRLHGILVASVVAAVLAATAALVVIVRQARPVAGEMSHDFGLVAVEEPETILEHVFRLTNLRSTPLKLVLAAPDCGCTTVDPPREAVAPGEDLVLPVYLKLRHSRYRASTVRLVFESGETVSLKIEARGRLIQPLRIRPMQIRVSVDRPGDVALVAERFEPGPPPQAQVNVPRGVTVRAGEWELERRGDAGDATPDLWLVMLRLEAQPGANLNGPIEIRVGDAPQLSVDLNVEAVSVPGRATPIP